MDETPLIQQYLQLRSEFMGYLYAMTRDAELAEEVYQNASVVVMEKAELPETIPVVKVAAIEDASVVDQVEAVTQNQGTGCAWPEPPGLPEYAGS